MGRGEGGNGCKYEDGDEELEQRGKSPIPVVLLFSSTCHISRLYYILMVLNE